MNKFIVTGNIVNENKYSDKMTRNTIAVKRDFKNDKGEYDTDFFDLVAFSHQADFMKKYINKGDKVEIVGRMQVRTYQTQDGINRKSYEVIVESISTLVKSKKEEIEEVTDEDFNVENVEDDMDIPF